MAPGIVGTIGTTCQKQDRAVVSYIFAIAVLNVGLGFAIAICLARRCRLLGDRDRAA